MRRRRAWIPVGEAVVSGVPRWISSHLCTSPEFVMREIGLGLSHKAIAGSCPSSSAVLWRAATASTVPLVRKLHGTLSVVESDEELAAPQNTREEDVGGVGTAVSPSFPFSSSSSAACDTSSSSLSFREREWDRRYQQLCRLVEECGGSFPIELSTSDGSEDCGERRSDETNERGEEGGESDASSLSPAEKRQLARWCRVQRRQYKRLMQKQEQEEKELQHGPGSTERKVRYVLSQRRLTKLLEIGFLFEPFATAWDQRYQELQDFYREHGHSVVPAHYVPNPSLAVWVGEQRYHFKKLREGRPTSMTPERIARLEQLDFAWNAYDVLWMHKYGELRQYMALRGKGRVPSLKNNPVLRRWVDQQRRLYRAKILDGAKNSLKPERETLLRELGILRDRMPRSATGTTTAMVQ